MCCPTDAVSLVGKARTTGAKTGLSYITVYEADPGAAPIGWLALKSAYTKLDRASEISHQIASTRTGARRRERESPAFCVGCRGCL